MRLSLCMVRVKLLLCPHPSQQHATPPQTTYKLCVACVEICFEVEWELCAGRTWGRRSLCAAEIPGRQLSVSRGIAVGLAAVMMLTAPVHGPITFAEMSSKFDYSNILVIMVRPQRPHNSQLDKHGLCAVKG